MGLTVGRKIYLVDLKAWKSRMKRVVGMQDLLWRLGKLDTWRVVGLRLIDLAR